MKRYYILCVAAAAVFLTTPTVAFAYDDLSGGWAVPSLDTSISIANDVMNQTIIREVVAKEARSKERANSMRDKGFQDRPVVQTAQQISSLNFTPSLMRRKQNLAQFINKTRPSNPDGAIKMTQMFASTDVISVIGRGIAPFGLRIDNVADAYTVYWTNAWLGSRGRDDTLSKQQISAVRNQAANALLASQGVATASDAGKQELAEALLVQAALIESYVANAKSDPALMTKVKAAIAQGAKRMGLDIYTMTLTDNGFVPAKRSSAVDNADLISGSESDEQTLASAMPSSDKEAPNYALIAAAGGAGLGGMFLLGKVMGRKS
jgi:hypothetical protein